jgi:integrase
MANHDRNPGTERAPPQFADRHIGHLPRKVTAGGPPPQAAGNQPVVIENVSYVFTVNKKQIYGNWMSGLFRPYVKQAGFYGKRLHWHNLRSSFASWLVERGVPIYGVSRLLGHASVKLTQKYYASLSPDTMHNEVAKIQLL